MDLPVAVAQAFAPDGVLSRTQAQFQPRAGQTEMALAVARTITHGGALVVEAGTGIGIGKTFAYLVPALLSGERVVLSTATKALQDQLFARDLPALVQAMGLPLRMALLKGRSSYLCLHRMEQARQHLPKPADPSHSVQLARWVGDSAERLGGRTLVLTTTLKALRAIGDVLQVRFQGLGLTHSIKVLVQGQAPKRRLMERFRADNQSGQPGCILVASATF